MTLDIKIPTIKHEWRKRNGLKSILCTKSRSTYRDQPDYEMRLCIRTFCKKNFVNIWWRNAIQCHRIRYFSRIMTSHIKTVKDMIFCYKCESFKLVISIIGFELDWTLVKRARFVKFESIHIQIRPHYSTYWRKKGIKFYLLTFVD